MEVNIPLLRKVVEWVEEQESLALADRRWYQGAWFRKVKDEAIQNINDPMCGTAMCVAGKIAFDDGWIPEVVVVNSTDPYRYAEVATKGGETRPIDAIAADLLGIDEYDANELFAGDNSARDIRRIAEGIAGQRL